MALGLLRVIALAAPILISSPLCAGQPLPSVSIAVVAKQGPWYDKSRILLHEEQVFRKLRNYVFEAGGVVVDRSPAISVEIQQSGNSRKQRFFDGKYYSDEMVYSGKVSVLVTTGKTTFRKQFKYVDQPTKVRVTSTPHGATSRLPEYGSSWQDDAVQYAIVGLNQLSEDSFENARNDGSASLRLENELSRIELSVWSDVLEANSVEAYCAYVDAYPTTKRITREERVLLLKQLAIATAKKLNTNIVHKDGRMNFARPNSSGRNVVGHHSRCVSRADRKYLPVQGLSQHLVQSGEIVVMTGLIVTSTDVYLLGMEAPQVPSQSD